LYDANFVCTISGCGKGFSLNKATGKPYTNVVNDHYKKVHGYSQGPLQRGPYKSAEAKAATRKAHNERKNLNRKEKRFVAAGASKDFQKVTYIK
jgi:hypothetical protein